MVNGEPELSALRGEVVRFYLTNTANTRVFNVRFSGAKMKLTGGDSGRCEREEFVDGLHRSWVEGLSTASTASIASNPLLSTVMKPAASSGKTTCSK